MAMIGRIGNKPPPPQAKSPSDMPSPQGNASFQDVLSQGAKVGFSKHAMHRAEQRGIAINENLLSQLDASLEKAQAKGAKNILAFDANRAFIVNVPNCRVITALSQEEMKENMFTNIDGAIIL